jgi:hypothetical protein
MEKIKTDIARQEGEKTAVMSDLEKEFKIKSLDEAYNKYEGLEKQIKDKKADKDKLMTRVEGRLKEYGY